MDQSLLVSCYIFVLAAFLGHHVIHRVPPLLHTPLMAGTNAIAGVSLVASLVPAGAMGADWSVVTTILGAIAVFCASINAIGGFLITDRMLKMFRKKPAPKAKGH
jgi:H+-translocating NAD(P) transhydrogenase subunit alpha